MDTEDDTFSDDHDVSDDVVSSDSDFTPETNSGDHREKSYKVLSEEDIKRIQDDRIERVTTSLYVSSGVARVLLNKFKWNVNELQESWFTDEGKTRKDVGLAESRKKHVGTKKIEKLDQLNCSICFEDFVCDVRVDNCVLCDHQYCNCCWNGYISNAISEGSGCLSLRCPDPDCDVVVTDELVSVIVGGDDKLRYERLCVRAYVEGNEKVKWCPGPDCGFAVEYDDVVGSGEGYDVVCGCGYCFCCNCGEDGHRPVDCETVAKWVEKNNAESENTTWILVYTKPCPKCRRPIEKNDGCMHMTCRKPCGYSFCWVCLDDWGKHAYNSCNSYAGRVVKENNDEERVKQRARISLERYTHYFERWAANNKSMKKSFADLQRMRDENHDVLLAKHAQSSSQLKFVLDAWTQIVECRRVLKWTYAYGYYLPEDNIAKTKLFEYLQGEAEAALENLHHCAEKELTEFLRDGTTAEFNTTFREKLANLTSVTKTYFANLVEALENGLADVDSGSANKKLKTGSSSN
ncbi:hypothetical protein DCAR_0622749 [Daucus carota subsp. sativus]|uniref:RBR-type E3 ubiquitin transferase n=1 Tax=Daucus carota subsp. sativus TaxID=79200 RepID=A0A164UUE6_DAUCS|nr:PREDICTED: probable E3 ubiquitin-protein ligase ARI7 [Daucus carota subsp. sativus]WOH03275.1 hypothetical protein DCAR_0622671 [Daucus carota subsp. sativus]WOH03352.1 hypothetical protein DCAR_0622749 [Daucus carota subsp. sativus]